MGAGSPTVLANRLHNVEMVIREFITLTHTFCLSWTHSSGHTFSTVCPPCLLFPSLGSRGWPGPSAGKVKHKSLNPQGLVKTHRRKLLSKTIPQNVKTEPFPSKQLPLSRLAKSL